MSILNRFGAQFDDHHYDNIMQVLDIVSKFSDHQAYNLAQELKGNKVGFFWDRNFLPKLANETSIQFVIEAEYWQFKQNCFLRLEQMASNMPLSI